MQQHLLPRLRRATLLLPLLALTMSSSGFAQVAVPEPLRSIHLASTIRVVTGGSRFEGTVIGLTADSLAMTRARNPTLRLSLAAVDSLWHRQHQFGRAVRRGAAGGAIVGLLAAFALTIPTCSRQGCYAPGVLLVSGALTGIGAVGGALMGTAVGAATRPWQLVHPEK